MEIEVKGHSGCQIDVVSEEGESVIALFGDLIAGGVVGGFHPDQPRFF